MPFARRRLKVVVTTSVIMHFIYSTPMDNNVLLYCNPNFEYEYDGIRNFEHEYKEFIEKRIRDVTEYAELKKCIEKRIQNKLSLDEPMHNKDVSPLAWAVRHNFCDLAEQLLHNGASPHVQLNTVRNPCVLDYACNRGSVPMVKLLLQYKADPNAQDTLWGNSPLFTVMAMLNIDGEQKQIARQLIWYGARKNFCNVQDKTIGTYLDAISQSCKMPMLQILWDSKKQQEEHVFAYVKNGNVQEIRKCFMRAQQEKCMPLDLIRDEDGNTILHTATQTNEGKKLFKLIVHQYPHLLTTSNKKGYTPVRSIVKDPVLFKKCLDCAYTKPDATSESLIVPVQKNEIH